MDYEFFKIAGAVAGIGGLALASVVYIFREVIRKEIFPRLSKGQAYQLLNRIIILIFVIGVLGIAAYLIVNWQNKTSGSITPGLNTERGEPKTTPTPVTAELSGTVVDQNQRPLQGAKVTLDEIPGMSPAETSSDGVFNLHRIPKAPGDSVRVRVVMSGYVPNPYMEDVVLGRTPPIISLRKK